MRSEDIAWAAGLFEGEGCFTSGIQRQAGKEYQRPRATMSMSDLDIIDRFHTIVGVGTICILKRKNPKYKTMYQWQAVALNDIYYIIELFSPFLGYRRLSQIIEMWSKGVGRRENGVAQPPTPPGVHRPYQCWDDYQKSTPWIRAVPATKAG